MSSSEEVLQKKIQRKKDAAEIRNFKLQQRTFILTSRFNTKTREENERFREKNWEKDVCIVLQNKYHKRFHHKQK